MKLPRIGPTRLGLRIYLVSASTVLVALLGLVVALRLAWDPRRDPWIGASAYSARQLALRWPSTSALAEELERIRVATGQLAAVFRWDGTLVASSGPPPPPLSEEELRRLRSDGTVPVRCHDPPCGIAFPLGDSSAPGYAVIGPGGPGGPHGGPGGPGRPGGPPPPGGPGWRPPLPPVELILVALVLVGLGAAAALLGRSIAGPLQRLARTAQALGRGELSARTGIRRRDELGEVARAFDEMASRLVELLRSQSELIANVAHELRTPLARIRVALDLAEDGDDAAARTSLAEITEDLGELERLVDDVLASSRMDLAASAPPGAVPTMHRAPVDLGALLRGSAEKLSHRYPDREVQLQVEGPLPAIDGDAMLLRRTIDNLLDNARKYSAPAQPIVLRAMVRPGAIEVQVQDQGEGIAPEDLARLFTPFFRADPSRARRTGGVGLGLTLSRRIAEAHGGTLVAESELGRGTTMTLTLPVAAS